MKDTKTTPQTQQKKAKASSDSNQKVAVVLVRGFVGLNFKVRQTLKLLRLHAKNNCVVIENTPITKGMLQKVKDFVTWGEIDDATFKTLVDKRGEEFLGRTTDSKGKYTYNTFFELNKKNYKKTFKLSPPRKGFGRKGIKTPFKLGGALGYRGADMKSLLERMM